MNDYNIVVHPDLFQKLSELLGYGDLWDWDEVSTAGASNKEWKEIVYDEEIDRVWRHYKGLED